MKLGGSCYLLLMLIAQASSESWAMGRAVDTDGWNRAESLETDQ